MHPDTLQLLQLLGVILATMTFGHLGYVIADGKGSPPRRWMLLTMLIPIVFLPAVLLVRTRRTEKKPYAQRAWTITGVGIMLQLATIVPEIVMHAPS